MSANDTGVSLTSRLVTVTRWWWATSTVQEVSGFKNPAIPTPPQCIINTKSCASLQVRSWRGLEPEKSWKLNGMPHGCYPGPDFRMCNLDLKSEIVLIYWPPRLASRELCGLNGTLSAQTTQWPKDFPTVITTDAITFRGQDIYRRYDGGHTLPSANNRSQLYIGTSVLSGPFTFTSPTVYLAHHQIVASIINRMDISLKTLRPAGLLSLKSEQVYSVRPEIPEVLSLDGLKYARRVARGDFEGNPMHSLMLDFHTDDYAKTLPLDFGHLQNPVPASVYFDARSEDCWGIQTHCQTITDDSYRPHIWIDDKVWNGLAPDNTICRPLDLVDPPVSLYRLDNVNDLPAASVSPVTHTEWDGVVTGPAPTKGSSDPRDNAGSHDVWPPWKFPRVGPPRASPGARPGLNAPSPTGKLGVNQNKDGHDSRPEPTGHSNGQNRGSNGRHEEYRTPGRAGLFGEQSRNGKHRGGDYYDGSFTDENGGEEDSTNLERTGKHQTPGADQSKTGGLGWQPMLFRGASADNPLNALGRIPWAALIAVVLHLYLY
jgi:hypothetical protein